MADRKYKLTFKLSDNTEQSVQFTVPQGDTGPAGKDGYTPLKGTDYYTEADKSEMVNAVIAALPVYNGEVVDV